MTFSRDQPEVNKDVVRHAKKRAVRHPRPDGYPKRPLTAFNIFFRCQRSKLIEPGSQDEDNCITAIELKEQIASAAAAGTKSGKKRSHRKTHGKISFGDLGRIIATRWKNIDPKIKEIYEAQAKEESNKYRIAVSEFHENMDIRATDGMCVGDAGHSATSNDALLALRTEQTELPLYFQGPRYESHACSSTNLEDALAKSMSYLPSKTSSHAYAPISHPLIAADKRAWNGDSNNMYQKLNSHDLVNNSDPLQRQLLKNYNIDVLSSIHEASSMRHLNTAFHRNGLIDISSLNSKCRYTNAGLQGNQDNCGLSHGQLSALSRDRALVEALGQGRNFNSILSNGVKPPDLLTSQNIGISSESSVSSQYLMRSAEFSRENNIPYSANSAQNAGDFLENHRYVMHIQEMKRLSDLDAQRRHLAQMIQNYSVRR